MKKPWLIVFNALTLSAWALFLLHALWHGLRFDTQGLVLLSIAQGLAIFEILNSILGLAGANWRLTTMQVSSRLLIVGLLHWLPMDLLAERGHSSGFAVVTIAWSITEIIRALYYLTDVLRMEVRTISWCRYTFFIVLYPIGVLGEFMVMYSFWEWRHFAFNGINIGLLIIALSYFIYFPKLYRHMFAQRRKKLC